MRLNLATSSWISLIEMSSVFWPSSKFTINDDVSKVGKRKHSTLSFNFIIIADPIAIFECVYFCLKETK